VTCAERVGARWFCCSVPAVPQELMQRAAPVGSGRAQGVPPGATQEHRSVLPIRQPRGTSSALGMETVPTAKGDSCAGCWHRTGVLGTPPARPWVDFCLGGIQRCLAARVSPCPGSQTQQAASVPGFICLLPVPGLGSTPGTGPRARWCLAGATTRRTSQAAHS